MNRDAFDREYVRVTFAAAAAFLEDPTQQAGAHLKVSWTFSDYEDAPADAANIIRLRPAQPNSSAYERDFGPAAFSRFVTALERRQNSALRGLDLLDVVWEGTPRGVYQRNDLERLFRAVLPVHPTLEELKVRHSTAFIQVLTSAIPVDHPTLRHVTLAGGLSNGDERAAVIAAWIRRNTPVTNLDLLGEFSDHGSEIVCQAMVTNTNLRSLRLSPAFNTGPDALRGLAMSPSMTQIRIVLSPLHNRLPDDFLATFMRELRTNTSLQHILLLNRDMNEAQRQPVLETLERFNYTLETFLVPYQNPSVESQLQRNRPIRELMNTLQARNFDVDLNHLPFVLERVRPFLTAVYTILRQGNLARMLEMRDVASQALTANVRELDDGTEHSSDNIDSN